MGTVCEARGSVPGRENECACEIHGGLGVPFHEVWVSFCGVFLKLQEGDCGVCEAGGQGAQASWRDWEGRETPVWCGF